MHLDDLLATHDLVLDDRFDGPDPDPTVWLPHHLPQWSSRERSAARWTITDHVLELRVDPDQPPWCPEFDGDVRVSSFQTGVRSGPIGSSDGQHRFNDRAVVREEQPTDFLHTPTSGVVRVRASMDLDGDSMAALWMIGVEDEPQHSGVIDVVEVFGSDVQDGTVQVGTSVQAFGDPSIVDDPARVALAVDVREVHDYAAWWHSEGVTFFVDDEVVRTSEQATDYPMQFMLGVYSFVPPSPDAFVPRFVVESFQTWEPRS